MSLAALLL